MRNLRVNEISDVSGGPLPLVAYVAGIVVADLIFIAGLAGVVAGAEAQANESKHQHGENCGG